MKKISLIITILLLLVSIKGDGSMANYNLAYTGAQVDAAIANMAALEAGDITTYLENNAAIDLGSPAGTYANLAALNAADPDHSKTYITLDDESWCYYSGAAFEAGGVYQATLLERPSLVPLNCSVFSAGYDQSSELVTAFDSYTKTTAGILTRFTRPGIANPSRYMNFSLISATLGLLSDLVNTGFYVYFDASASAQIFRPFILLTKDSSNWISSLQIDLIPSNKGFMYLSPEQIYDALIVDGFAPTDTIYLSFTHYEAVNEAPTTSLAVDVSIAVYSVLRSNYSTRNSVLIADFVNGFSPDEYVKAEDLEAVQGNYITCWGDSLTAGGGWTDRLELLSGKPLYNAGVGGETDVTIMARHGADVMIVNNITIPAGTTPVLIASMDVEGGISTELGNLATPGFQGLAGINPCVIDGILGTLAWTGAAPSDPDGTWTFTRSVAGTEKIIIRPVAITTDFDRNNLGGLQIIFMGTNGGYADNDDLVRQHNRMIAHSHASNTIILGLSTGSAASNAAYETAMEDAFGRYFISIRKYLAAPIYTGEAITSSYGLDDAGLNATQGDLDAIATGTVPPQLLADGIHYTTACKTVIGDMLYLRCRDLNIF